MLRHIQRLKTIVVGLYLRAFNYIEAHAEENFLYLCKSSIEWVSVAELRGFSRQGNVKPFSL